MLSVCVAPVAAKPVRVEFAGYAGNPGNVRVDVIGEYGVGPVYEDSTGLLYASAGTGRINAYRLDGTLEASYSLPDAEPFRRFDNMVNAGNGCLLVLAGGSGGTRSKGSVYRIRIGAPDGTKAEKVPGVENINGMAMSARDGKVILHRSNYPFIELDSVTLAVRDIGPPPGGTIGDGYFFCMLDWGPDGDLYWLHRHTELHRFTFRDGQLVEVVDPEAGWPQKCVIGLHRGRILGNLFWGLGGYDTLLRWDARTFRPAPGVVHGGTSGSFIGRVERNAEMSSDGICQIRDGLFAVTARNNGAVYILQWNPETLHMDEVRRIGALAPIDVLLLDARGMVYADNLVWHFDDDALAVPRFTYNMWRNFGGTIIENETAVVAAFDHDKLSFRDGRLDQELNDWDKQIPGAAFINESEHAGSFVGKSTTANIVPVIRVGQDGKGVVFSVTPNGAIRKDLNPKSISLVLSKTGAPEVFPTRVSSVADLPDGNLLAVADGKLRVFTPGENGNFHMSGDVNLAVGADSAIDADGTWVCMVEPASGSLRLIDLKTGAVLASLNGLDKPTRVAMRNGRICVYESGAQRIAKFAVRD